MLHLKKLAFALAFMLLAAPLMLTAVTVAALPAGAPAPAYVGVALAQDDEAPAAADEEPDLRTLFEMFQDAFTGPAAAGAFVVAVLGFVRQRYGGPKGILAVASVAAASLALGIGGATVGPIEGGMAAGVAFGVKTFAAAIAERELLVNALRSIAGEGGPQSGSSQDAARHRVTRG